jgi:hypothetical protein
MSRLLTVTFGGLLLNPIQTRLTQQMLHEAQVGVDLDPMDGAAHQALGFALMNDGHHAALAAILESGPIPAVHGVVRWRRKSRR